jgi:hypothetical protein
MDKAYELLAVIPFASGLGALALAGALVWFVITLRKYGPSIEKLIELERIGKLAILAENLEGSQKEFARSSMRVQSLTAQIAVFDTTMGSVVKILGDIAASNRERAVEEDIKESPVLMGGASATGNSRQNPSPGMQAIETNWNQVCGILEARIKGTSIKWDGRRVGALAYQLTDGRYRSKKIDIALADEIADLHGLYKSVIRKDNKLITDDFVLAFSNRANGIIKQLQGPE